MARRSHFEPGQYLTIGVESNGKFIQRPYSVACSPRDIGTTATSSTSGSWPAARSRRCCGGSRSATGMRMIGPKGQFILEPDDDRTHVFISSGTGIAPFVVDDEDAASTTARPGRP